MSTEAPPTHASPPAKGGEISLEDLDRLLEAEDPGFGKSLDDVRAVESDANITIEATAIDELETGEAALKEPTAQAPAKGWHRRFLRWVKARLADGRYRIQSGAAHLGRQSLVFLQTRPKELFYYSLSTARVLIHQSKSGLAHFREASRAEKLGTLALVALVAASLWMFGRNIKGHWLPRLTAPELTRFQDYADWTETYDEKEPEVSFYSAFPQERHEYLFGKMKVNLRRTEEHPLPMGAFELVTLVDSKDTAIEMRDREIEFSDLLQRVFEEESFSDLETESGKGRVKNRLKRELNQKLTQGWVKEIDFKTFILKP